MTSLNGSAATEPERLSLSDLVKAIPTTTRVGEPRPAAGATEFAKVISRIGRRYGSASFNAYKASHPLQERVLSALRSYAAEWEENRAMGQGLLLYGPRGTGKDHLAVATLGNIMLRFDFRVEWVDGQELYAGMRDKIGSDATEQSQIQRFTLPDLLIISDPLPTDAKESLSSFQLSTLWRIIDRRYRDLKPTWVTLNVADFAEASKRLSPQIADRLSDGVLALHCDWPSFRKPALVVK